MPLSGSWRIYENDPARVPPLVIQRKQFLDRKRYPFYLHTDGVLLVVRREGVQNLSYLAQVVVLTGSAQFCQSATIKVRTKCGEKIGLLRKAPSMSS